MAVIAVTEVMVELETDELNRLLTPRAKKVIQLANKEAESLAAIELNTDHLLLGLIRENDGVAGNILIQFGFTYGWLLDQIRTETISYTQNIKGKSFSFSDEVEAVLQKAKFFMAEFGHQWIGTEHILLGIIKTSCQAQTLLNSFENVDLLEMEVKILNLIAPESPEAVIQQAKDILKAIEEIGSGSDEQAYKKLREKLGEPVALAIFVIFARIDGTLMDETVESFLAQIGVIPIEEYLSKKESGE